ncbi:hypothetical protein CA265_14065 [Sphingobacteriaceae bacterium GW460-11-11-14-LB5]|nr:hypothetical protein CA265_14065 [Sphingobacteriaceae bacterium GW460-11-11-14-LB5]
MKTIYFTLLFFLSLTIAQAQSIKPYIAVLKTQNGKYKGILYKVDSVNAILNHDGEFIKVPVSEIKTVQIRTIKKGYEGMSFIKIGETRSEEYKMDASGRMVDQWGKEEPTFKEDVSATFFSVIFTVLANAVALPIHAINPNLARFNFRKPDGNKLNELSYYSIYYQANPNVLAELHQLKTISAKFKP